MFYGYLAYSPGNLIIKNAAIILGALLIDFLIILLNSKKAPERLRKLYLHSIVVSCLFFIAFSGSYFFYSNESCGSLIKLRHSALIFNFFLLLYVPRAVFIIIFSFIILLKKTKIHFYFRLLNTITIAVFLIILFSMTAGVSFIKMNRESIVMKDLPVETNRLRIIQLSDLHIGTLSSQKFLKKIIKKINSENPDLILFTGDIVTFNSSELEKKADFLKNLKCKYGKIAVLGNHDFGDYVTCYSQKEKDADIAILSTILRNSEFKVLRNSNYPLVIGKDSITFAGTDNFAYPPYRSYCDLEKALTGTNRNNFIILLSHNPQLWDKINSRKPQIRLMLSGHTHGGQIGIISSVFSFSAIAMKYNHWHGTCRDSQTGQFLHINNGIGTVGFWGRFGIWPSIDLITLEKGDH